jgi:hypothetical protein
MAMTTQRAPDRPYVTSYEPGVKHRRLFRFGNVFSRAMIRSPFGAKMQGLSVLSFEGRKTGRRYDVPVSVMDLDGTPIVLTASPWRRNLRGGADVEVRAGHTTRRMRAGLVEDAERVADAYEELLPTVGVKHANRLGLVLAGDRFPTHEELIEGIAGRRAMITLVDR